MGRGKRDKRTYHHHQHRRAYLFFSWISKGDIQWYFKVRFMKELNSRYIGVVMTMMRVFLINSMYTLYWEIFNELDDAKKNREEMRYCWYGMEDSWLHQTIIKYGDEINTFHEHIQISTFHCSVCLFWNTTSNNSPTPDVVSLATATSSQNDWYFLS